MIDRGKRNLLGILVNAVDYEAAVEQVMSAADGRCGFGVSALAVHGVMVGATGGIDRRHINELELVTPDGQPVRWGLNLLYRTHLKDRVYGPDLTLRVCARAAETGLSVFFYGSTREVLDRLTDNLAAKWPALRIAGAEPSKFRPLSEGEKDDLAEQIRSSGARLAFVGLGCPRQEVFVHEFKQRLDMPLLAVGAAFDFHAGLLPQAPRWMQNHGLEWLFRLGQEPRRLWKRYLLLNPYYILLVTLQFLGLKRFETNRPEIEAPSSF